jgi:NAD(P)-dependent dehydrogenase (short-subunit alcohol dehydrogenase family)
LITGATDGVGKATALGLARSGFTVVLAVRDAAKAEVVKGEIALATGASDVDYIVGDLSSLTQTRRIAEIYQARYPKLDVLINNAGIFSARHTLTEDRFETTYQVNYLAHVLLTQLLLAPLKASGQGRIVNLTSNAYVMGQLEGPGLGRDRRFSTMGSYATSKLLVLLWTIELAERLSGTGVTANAVHPGVVRTQMLTGATGLFKLVALLATPFAISPQAGAATSLHVATSPGLVGVTGRYFAGSTPAPVKSKASTAENRALLWDATLAQLAQRDRPPPVSRGTDIGA